jgi:tripartite-type tricarboxylate transporter receptor subunit TctC
MSTQVFTVGTWPRRHCIALAALTLAAVAGTARAEYPNDKILTIVVPFPAGGGLDNVGRIVAESFRQKTGATVVVDNRPGAAGTIGITRITQAKPDGYTIGVAAPGAISIAPIMYPNLPYNPVKSLTAAALMVRMPLLLVAKLDAPFSTAQELIAYAKAHPDKLNYGSGGNGSSPHMAGEMFKQMADIKTEHVPYSGSTPLLTDLLGGQVDYAFTDTSTIPSIQAGKLKLLAVTTAKRSKLLPDTLTMAEIGVRGFEASNWYGLVLPVGVAPSITLRLNQMTAAALADPEVVVKLEAQFVEIAPPITPQEFADFIMQDTEKWSAVARKGGLKGN